MKIFRILTGTLMLPLLLTIYGHVAYAQKKPTKQQLVSATPFQKISKIHIAPEIAKVSQYMRIKNLVNGRTLEVPIEGRESVDLQSLNSLVDNLFDNVLLEFSLYFLEKRSDEAVRRQLFDGTRETTPTLSPRRYQPVRALWRRVGYTIEKDGENHLRFHVRSGIRTIFISERDAANRREAVEKLDSRKIFDEAWKALHQKRYDVALAHFNEIIRTEKLLNASQITQARMGRGISRFHQMGCKDLEEDFKVAATNPDNLDDVNYYRGLCLVEAKNFKESMALFDSLVQKRSKSYEEPARFYKGLSVEMLGQPDEAESIYLDVVDFSEDSAVIALAQQRLKHLEAERNKTWKPRWLTLAFSASSGFDSNVVGLPGSLSASAYDLSSESSASLTLAPLLAVSYALKPGVTHAWRYTFAGLYYFNQDIGERYGALSHDLTTSLFVAANETNSHTVNLGGNTFALGELSAAEEFMRIYTLDYTWTHLTGMNAAGESDVSWSYYLKAQLQLPQQEAASSTSDLEAYSYQMSVTRVKSLRGMRSYGYAMRGEYKPSAGSENSVIDGGISLSFNRPMFGWNSARLEQSVDFDYYTYYQSSADRKDTAAKYNLGIAYSLIEGRLESRLAFQYHMNFSSESSYRYNKYTAALSLSGSF